jgi:hypothetical protein
MLVEDLLLYLRKIRHDHESGPHSRSGRPSGIYGSAGGIACRAGREVVG